MERSTVSRRRWSITSWGEKYSKGKKGRIAQIFSKYKYLLVPWQNGGDYNENLIELKWSLIAEEAFLDDDNFVEQSSEASKFRSHCYVYWMEITIEMNKTLLKNLFPSSWIVTRAKNENKWKQKKKWKRQSFFWNAKHELFFHQGFFRLMQKA
jgi:hypothetical protein